jgi:hypothetical protein
MAFAQVDVYYSDGEWKVESGQRVVSTHRKKSAARRKGKTVAENKENRVGGVVALNVFNKDGSLQNVKKYGGANEGLFL